MKKDIVRLASLTLKNIKNVANGTIVMPLNGDKTFAIDQAEILGIYGQNGSGKTAVVDAFYFLQRVMQGVSVSAELNDYIDTDATEAEINAEFKIYRVACLYEVGYHVCFARQDGQVIIKREHLNCAINTEDGKRSNKIIFMDYCHEDTENIFMPQKRLNELIGKNKNLKTDLLVAKKMAEKSNCSYIFGDVHRDIISKNTERNFAKYKLVIIDLFNFAWRDLFVIRNSRSGYITANIALYMAFRYENEYQGLKGDLPIPLKEPVVIGAKSKKLLDVIVEQINIVLCTIIPGMKIEVKDYGEQALDNGETGHKVELMSVRNGRKAIPIRMESDGIIKIVSILNVLIQAFGNPSICLVIDELDAGIFEYMLGELLDVFAKYAKGQLIFTSHNLRALEMLESNNIMFSTTNPENRYMQMKKVKESNNLRCMYIRSITLGGQEEEIYEETDSIKIARAFRKAGKALYEEGEKGCSRNS